MFSATRRRIKSPIGDICIFYFLRFHPDFCRTQNGSICILYTIKMLHTYGCMHTMDLYWRRVRARLPT